LGDKIGIIVLGDEDGGMERFAVIIPAAGSSTRFGAGRNKLLEPLAGEPVLARTIRAFERPDVAVIFVATSITNFALHENVVLCPGGASRAESVRNALLAVPTDIEWVAVHDAARPLVSRDLIDSTFAAAIQYGAAVPALPVTLTVKQADGPLPAKVQRTLPRHALWAMQTPQAMRRSELVEAFARCPMKLDQVTDDVQLLELMGRDVWLVPGEERNLKITTWQDMVIAEALFRRADQA
jgi:2-C-methyl-D-erythritol 4-phosphate cytidylyltransferase